MELRDLEKLHSDPSNWHLLFFYVSPADPRLVVRKRYGRTGWTINFGRPFAIPFILIVLSAIYGIMHLSDRMQWGDTGFWLTVIFILVGTASLFGWLASPKRYTGKV